MCHTGIITFGFWSFPKNQKFSESRPQKQVYTKCTQSVHKNRLILLSVKKQKLHSSYLKCSFYVKK